MQQGVTVFTVLSFSLGVIYERVPLRDLEWVPPVVLALIPHVRAKRRKHKGVLVIYPGKEKKSQVPVFKLVK